VCVVVTSPVEASAFAVVSEAVTGFTAACRVDRFAAGLAVEVEVFAALGAGVGLPAGVAAGLEPATSALHVIPIARRFISTGLPDPITERDGAPLLSGATAVERLELPLAECHPCVLVELLEARGLLDEHVLLHRAIGPHHEIERDGSLDGVLL